MGGAWASALGLHIVEWGMYFLVWGCRILGFGAYRLIPALGFEPNPSRFGPEEVVDLRDLSRISGM